MCMLEFGSHKKNTWDNLSHWHRQVITVTNLYTYSVIATNFLYKHRNLLNFDQCDFFGKGLPSLNKCAKNIQIIYPHCKVSCIAEGSLCKPLIPLVNTNQGNRMSYPTKFYCNLFQHQFS